MPKSQKSSKDSPRSEKPVTVVGFVDEFDTEDGTVGLRISTDAGETLRVHLDRKGKELLDLIEEEIVATGVLQKDRSGKAVLRVQSYEIVDYEDDDEDDEDEEDYLLSDYDETPDDDGDFRPRRPRTGTDD